MNTQFLSGGGEMGALIRAKDWSATPVGNPDTWPQSLRTTLSILLSSKFPMFLWWGPGLICFYNDAYRPSLGQNGKHPSILGQRAEEAWPEIWDIIKPLIDQVLSGGEATFSEDQLIPIYRNGKIEDVYWTFSYSPVNDESGKPAGVFVTCSETTQKIRILQEIKENEERLKFTVNSAELAKKKLEENERNLQTIIRQAPVAIAIFRGSGHTVEIANIKALELWGRKRQDVMERPILEAMPELSVQGIKELLDNVYHTGNNFSATELPVQIARKGRLETAYINFVYEPLYHVDGAINGIMTVGFEVTEQVFARRKIEEAVKEIKENEERLHIVIDASELGTWEWDIQTDEIIYSGRYLDIFGYPAGSVVSHATMLAHLHPEDKAIRDRALELAFQTGVLNYETRTIWNDRSIHWMEAKGKVFYDEERRPVRLIGTLRDTTAEKFHQQELMESEQKFRLLADSMPQFVWTGDAEGNLNYFNRSVYNYSGLTHGQMQKDGWLQIVHPDERERNVEQWINSITTGKPFIFEHRFRRHDGEYRWQLSRAIPQKDVHGNIQMWVGTSTDIQDQKTFTGKLESQVHERTRELEQKNKELATMNIELQSFAYVSSHDLQEPLRKIQAFSSRLLEKENQNLSESGKDYFSRIQGAAKRMQTLIEDLLAYSRMNTSQREFSHTDLNDIVAEVRYDLKESIAEKEAILDIGDLGNADIIPFQFKQLLHNLIGNSLKFSTPGTPPHIIIRSEKVNGFFHITLSDNGIGFDPQYKDRIFEVFQRLHGKDAYAGTGIGLAIVKKIVENHHGMITATGELNKGARFDISIPD